MGIRTCTKAGDVIFAAELTKIRRLLETQWDASADLRWVSPAPESDSRSDQPSPDGISKELFGKIIKGLEAIGNENEVGRGAAVR
jgi:hypothetical protein